MFSLFGASVVCSDGKDPRNQAQQCATRRAENQCAKSCPVAIPTGSRIPGGRIEGEPPEERACDEAHKPSEHVCGESLHVPDLAPVMCAHQG